MKYPVGSYMTQSNNPNQYRSVYVIEGSGPQDEIEVYDTPQDVAFDIPAHYIPLPYYCSGTGHAVYRWVKASYNFTWLKSYVSVCRINASAPLFLSPFLFPSLSSLIDPFISAALFRYLVFPTSLFHHILPFALSIKCTLGI